MPNNHLARRLGDIAYVISHEGVLIRSAVGSLLPDGKYTLLLPGDRPHFFTLEEAVDAAEVVIKHRLIHERTMSDETRSELNGRLALLRDVRYLEEVEKQPIIMHLMPGAPKQAIDLGPVPVFPTEYFEPGTPVFLVIRPNTKSNHTQHFRPKPYFLLSTVVSFVEVLPSLKNYVMYGLSGTHFTVSPSFIFADERLARKALSAAFTQETDGVIKLKDISIYDVSEERDSWNKRVESLHGEDASVQVVNAA